MARVLNLVTAATALAMLLALISCNKTNENQSTPNASLPPAPAPPQPDPPADQEVSVNLIYAGEVDGSSKVGFDFRVLWGDWKSNKKAVQMASHAPQTSQLDLGSVDAKVLPVFPGGTECQYVVKIQDKQGKLMGEFNITATGKQVKLGDSATPGYSQRFIYYDQSRYVTAYTLREKHGKKLGAEVGILFIGEGWKAVDESKRKSVVGKYDFPKIDMVVLPSEWMEYNEINQTFRTLKRGKVSSAGTCYS